MPDLTLSFVSAVRGSAATRNVQEIAGLNGAQLEFPTATHERRSCFLDDVDAEARAPP
jgi:hypothetical protein